MIIIVVLVLLTLLGAPLFAAILASTMFGFHSEGVNLSAVAIEIYRIADMPVLVAIPLFTFAGYLLGESQAPRRLVRVTNALVGWLPGGLAIVALLASALFTAFTGASGATIVALGALLYPALQQAGYSERFNLGLITTSGSLGLLFAPSLPLILYGIIAEQMNLSQTVTVDRMFLAGILPGALMLGLLAAWSLWENRRLDLPLKEFSWRELGAALRESIWEIPLPFIVLGGVYGGYLALSEAAAVTAFYVLIVEVFVYREIGWRRLARIMSDSMVLVGGLLIILGAAMASTDYLIDAGLPTKLFALIKAHVSSPLAFLMLLNLFLLVLGMMLEIFAAMIIVVPLILPVAIGYGIDPVHLGIIFLANMQIGYFMPPVGMSLFIVSYRFNKPVDAIVRSSVPFFFILLLAVLIITYWPWLSLALLPGR